MLAFRGLAVGLVLLFIHEIGASSAGRAEENAENKPHKPQVICPAIDEEIFERPINASTSFPIQPIELVVLGTARSLADKPGYDTTHEITIEKVLYGSSSDKTIRFTNDFAWMNRKEDGPLIFGLVPNAPVGTPDYIVKYQRSAKDEKAQLALAAARLDYHVLSADCIFVGKESGVDREGQHTIEVVRLLHGAKPKVGEECVVEFGRNGGLPLKACKEPMLYLVKIERHVPTVKDYLAGICRLPVACEADVIAALKRREAYPVVETVENGHLLRCREVTFRGPIEEAIELLGSESSPAQTLGRSRLMKEKDAARDKLAAAVEREMFRQAEPVPAQFRRLHNAIRLLGSLEAESPKGILARLLEKQLAFLATSPPEPPEIKRQNDYDDHQDDANHSLEWLVTAMDEHALARDFGERLLKLRDQAHGRWKAEVQAAIDAAGVEDNLELALLAKGQTATPVRSQPRPYSVNGVKSIAFSHDGMCLATGGIFGNVRIWNIADWKVAYEIDFASTIESLAFSPDDQYLYVAGRGNPQSLHCRLQWRSGKLDKVYEGHEGDISHLEISPDGKTMISMSEMDARVYVWNTDTAAITRTIKWRGNYFQFAPTRNLLLVGRYPACYSDVFSLESDKSKPNELPVEFSAAAFLPDGKDMVIARNAEEGDEWNLQLRKLENPFQLSRESKPLSGGRGYERLAISPDGKQLAVATSDTRLGTYAVPDLKPLREFSGVHRRKAREIIEQLAYSPNGKWLAAVKTDRRTPLLFDGQTGEEVMPYEGNGDRIVDLRFSSDGRTLRSVGWDGSVCTWDASTMKMIRRFSLPLDRIPVEIRPSDGRYALCPSSANPKLPLQVIDLDNGKVRCEVALPLTWYEFTDISERLHGVKRLYWLPDDLVFCSTFFIGGNLDSEEKWWRFNCRTGEKVAEGKIDLESQNAVLNGRGELCEDGRHLFYAQDGGKGSLPFEAEEIDLATLFSKKLGEIPTKDYPDGDFGLVPGGKYFHIGTQVFDRKTRQLVSAKVFPGHRLGAITFSDDGSRYAVAVADKQRESEERQGRFGYEKEPGLVRIHETATGRTLMAFPYPVGVERLRFSPDGKQVAVVEADGTIAVWRISD